MQIAGTPVIAEKDKPVSFLVRGFMRPPEPESESDEAEAAEPAAATDSDDTPTSSSTKRGLTVPRCRTPIPSKAMQRQLANDKMLGYVIIDGVRHLKLGDGDPFPIGFEYHPGPMKGIARVLPRPGYTKPSRGRKVPTADSGERSTGRTYTCLAKDCRKVFLTSMNLKRHVNSIHGDVKSTRHAAALRLPLLLTRTNAPQN